MISRLTAINRRFLVLSRAANQLEKPGKYEASNESMTPRIEVNSSGVMGLGSFLDT